MVTISVEMDLTLGDDTEIPNCVCVLVATKGNGIPLCPRRRTVKLCMGFGQEHPEDVLQLSDTETVLAFQCDYNMMATMCHLTAAMVWHGEPVKLHV